MFLGKLGKAAPIKKIFDSLRGLVPEIRVLIKMDGMYFLGLDDQRLCLFKLYLPKDKFKSYQFDFPLAFCVKTLFVAKVLYLVSRSDIISFSAAESSPYFHLECESENNKKVTSFDIKLRKDSEENLQPPEVEFTSILSLRSYAFAKLSKQMKDVAETVVISSCQEYIEFNVQKDDCFGNFKIYLNKPHIPTHQINEDDEDQPANAKYRGELLSNLCFSTRFLYVISRVCSLSEEVKIKMSAEQPMLVEFKMPEHGIIQYYLQPMFSDYLYM